MSLRRSAGTPATIQSKRFPALLLICLKIRAKPRFLQRQCASPRRHEPLVLQYGQDSDGRPSVSFEHAKSRRFLMGEPPNLLAYEITLIPGASHGLVFPATRKDFEYRLRW